VVFGVSSCRETHTLFILTAIQREDVAVIPKGFAQTWDIAVAEYPKTATANAGSFAVYFDE